MPTRAAIAREVAEVRAHRQTFLARAYNEAETFAYRYEAAVMIDVCDETLADLDEMLRLLPEV